MARLVPFSLQVQIFCRYKPGSVVWGIMRYLALKLNITPERTGNNA